MRGAQDTRALRPLIDELYNRTRRLGGSGPNPYWSQPNWYVDWVHGNDANPGTLAAPVKTVMGGIVTSKWGTSEPLLAQMTRIFSLTPQPLNAEYIVLKPILVNGGSLDVIVTPQPVGGVFAAGAVTSKVRGAPGTSLKVAGLTGAGVAALQLVHNTHAGRDSWASIDALSGGGVATMTQPFDSAGLLAISATPTWNEEDGWTAGDTLQVYEQGLLNLKVFQPSGGDSNPGFTAGVCSVQGAFLPDVSGVPGDSDMLFHPFGVGVVLVNCRFDPFLQLNGSDQAFICSAINCVANGGLSLLSAQFIGGSSNTSGNEFNETLGGLNVIDGDAILHGSGPGTQSLIVHGGGYTNFGFAQFPDAGTIIAFAHGGLGVLEPGFISSPVGCQVWGAALTNTQGPSHVHLEPVPGQTWTACVTLSGGMFIEAVGTGAKYVPGAPGQFTDGIAITPGNLDTFHGLTNPLLAGGGYIGG